MAGLISLCSLLLLVSFVPSDAGIPSTISDTTLVDTTVAATTDGATTDGATADGATTDGATTDGATDAPATDAPSTEVATGTETMVSTTISSGGMTEASTYEATSYYDETAAFCVEYLLNNTNWEPYPTYADNGATTMSVHLSFGVSVFYGCLSAGLFV